MVKSTHVCLAETWKKILPNSSHTEMCRVIASWANELVMIFSWNSKWIWKHKFHVISLLTVDDDVCLLIFHSIPFHRSYAISTKLSIYSCLKWFQQTVTQTHLRPKFSAQVNQFEFEFSTSFLLILNNTFDTIPLKKKGSKTKKTIFPQRINYCTISFTVIIDICSCIGHSAIL